jgi:hypothetical protein
MVEQSRIVKKFLYHSIAAMAFLCLVSSPAQAQTSAAVPPPGPDIKIRFRTLGWDVDRDSGLYYSNDKKDSEVGFHSDGRSVFYDYKGPSLLIFYKYVDGPEGKQVQVPVAQADLRDVGAWALLIFFKDPKNPDLYQVQVLADDLQAFPAGTYRYVNFGSVPMKIRIGDQQANLVPSAVKNFLVKPKGDMRVLQTTVSYDQPEGNVLAYSNNWAFFPTMRSLIFICSNPDRPGSYQVKRLAESAEFPPDDAKSEKAP